MPRSKLPLGTYGNLYSVENPNGTWTAKARFRDMDGKTRLIKRNGTSKAKAEKALKEHFAKRSNEVISSTLEPTSTLEKLASQWWEEYTTQEHAIQTEYQYRRVLDTFILPRLGEVTIIECSVGVLTGKLKGIIKDHGHAAGLLSKTVLSNMFKFAAARDAIKSNPIRDVVLPSAPKSKVKALTYPEAVQLRSQLTGDVRAVLDVLLGTGCRIGEALALRWKDVDLTPGSSLVSINGTLVTDTAGKLVRQEHPKTKNSKHSLFLPDFVADMLRERAQNHIPAHATSTEWATPDAYIFPSAKGTAWDTRNFRKKWRAQVKAAGFEGVKPHEIRKTVATYLANAESITAASLQLGHSSEQITEKHYVARNEVAPDMSALLQAFGNANKFA